MRITFLVPLYIFIILLSSIQTSPLIASSYALRGVVLDFFSKKPISNATILVVDEEIRVLRTNDQGLFHFKYSKDVTLIIYHQNRNGVLDYMPAKIKIKPDNTSSLRVFLVPSGIVRLNGSLFLIEFAVMESSYMVSVLLSQELPPYTVLSYGAFSDVVTLLNLSSNLVIVPAEIPFRLRISTLVRPERIPEVKKKLGSTSLTEAVEELLITIAFFRSAKTLIYPLKGSLLSNGGIYLF